MMTNSQPSEAFIEFEKFYLVLQKYRELVLKDNDTYADHLNTLNRLSEVFEKTPQLLEHYSTLNIINEIYQNGVQKDDDNNEYHLELNNAKIRALICCLHDNHAYLEYQGLVVRGDGYTDYTMHTMILSMLYEEYKPSLAQIKVKAANTVLLHLCEEYEGFTQIDDDNHDTHHTLTINTIHSNITLLLLIRENEIIEERIKEVYEAAIKTSAVFQSELHLYMMNWAIKAKNNQMVNHIYETAKTNNALSKKIQKIYDSYEPLLSPVPLILSSSTDSNKSEEKVKVSPEPKTLDKNKIVEFYSLLKKIAEAKQNNEANFLNQYFKTALTICPPSCFEDLFVITIQSAGDCELTHLALEVFNDAYRQGFSTSFKILLEFIYAMGNCKHLDFLLKAYTTALTLSCEQEKEILELKREGLHDNAHQEEAYHFMNLLNINEAAVKGLCQCGFSGLQKAYEIYQKIGKSHHYIDRSVYIRLIKTASDHGLAIMAYEIYLDAMQFDVWHLYIDIHEEMMWGAAINAKRELLEKVKEFADKKLEDAKMELDVIETIYQNACAKICDLQNLEHQLADVSLSARILAGLSGENPQEIIPQSPNPPNNHVLIELREQSDDSTEETKVNNESAIKDSPNKPKKSAYIANAVFTPGNAIENDQTEPRPLGSVSPEYKQSRDH